MNEYSNLDIAENAFASIASLGTEIFDNYDEKITDFKKEMGEESDDEDEGINLFTSPRDRNKILNERSYLKSLNYTA